MSTAEQSYPFTSRLWLLILKCINHSIPGNTDELESIQPRVKIVPVLGGFFPVAEE